VLHLRSREEVVAFRPNNKEELEVLRHSISEEVGHPNNREGVAVRQHSNGEVVVVRAEWGRI
jgi:hypothetical protein